MRVSVSKLKVCILVVFAVVFIFADNCLTLGSGGSEQAKQYNSQGIMKMTMGDSDNAILDFTRAVEIEPDNQFYYMNRGFAYASSGKYSQAIADCTKAINLNPDFAEAYSVRGGAYSMSGNPSQGLVDCNMAIKLEPDHGHNYQNRALAYFYNGEYDKSWDDVYAARRLGAEPNPRFIEKLKQASGREK